jgi:hypothetical protein
MEPGREYATADSCAVGSGDRGTRSTSCRVGVTPLAKKNGPISPMRLCLRRCQAAYVVPVYSLRVINLLTGLLDVALDVGESG